MQVKKRRLYDPEQPDGYLESDNDYVRNNFEACVKLLDEQLAPAPVKVSRWYTRARREALKHVEALARKILKQHPNLDEYVMAMGTAFFSDCYMETISVYDRAYMRSLSKFLDEWDEYLKLTGEPMRFTADGKKMTDW